MKATAVGYAIKDATGLLVCTVSDTRRAAMVNWLHITIMPVLASATDNEIAAAFDDFAPPRGAALVCVHIHEIDK